jgi:drug/metabolite transporter (DMT)-like permease
MKKQYLGIAVGVAAVSFAAILIRLADAPPLVIAAWRLTLAALVLWPPTLALARPELRALSRRDALLVFLSSIFLALHFGLWITSLSYTSIATSVILVTSSPLFVAAASWFAFRETVSRNVVAGIGVCIIGTLLIGFDNWTLGSVSLLGSVLAFLAALAVSGYLLIGRSLRRRMGILVYGSLTYTSCAVLLIIAALVAGEHFFGYSGGTYLWMVLLALGPQLLGHLSLNWALRFVSATLITIAVLGEPVGTNLLAFLIFHETPRLLEILGGVLILGGIGVTFWRESLRSPAAGIPAARQ